ncbi:hypothetical protein SZN_01519 [Streptomyces zinciresistens K42]|uniref:DUF1349 domain-containing protein n=1 Tax=Streptomyces zinciresistens K42 TaxID=700597 RepID=G2G4A2_9ACTN|nr:DUF1349 domain-containing protein [Streptomyces zinciresistens]EGX61577.1 hypothetical protein SZN_01519 [Streptomyces zinciresistens K42]
MDRPDTVAWQDGTWLNEPPRTRVDGDGLLVTARGHSDFWRTTAYGFVRDDGHALLRAFPPDSATEVTFVVDFEALYDQAGLMIRVDAETWIKAGVEMSDGLPQLGAVVTRGVSDWSVAPVPEWQGRAVTVRASRTGDAVTIRARCEDGPWRLVRLAPLAPDATATAGPFCCSPERDGLQVRFTHVTQGPADTALHEGEDGEDRGD